MLFSTLLISLLATSAEPSCTVEVKDTQILSSKTIEDQSAPAKKTLLADYGQISSNAAIIDFKRSLSKATSNKDLQQVVSNMLSQPRVKSRIEASKSQMELIKQAVKNGAKWVGVAPAPTENTEESIKEEILALQNMLKKASVDPEDQNRVLLVAFGPESYLKFVKNEIKEAKLVSLASVDDYAPVFMSRIELEKIEAEAYSAPNALEKIKQLYSLYTSEIKTIDKISQNKIDAITAGNDKLNEYAQKLKVAISESKKSDRSILSRVKAAFNEIGSGVFFSDLAQKPNHERLIEYNICGRLPTLPVPTQTQAIKSQEAQK